MGYHLKSHLYFIFFFFLQIWAPNQTNLKKSEQMSIGVCVCVCVCVCVFVICVNRGHTPEFPLCNRGNSSHRG